MREASFSLFRFVLGAAFTVAFAAVNLNAQYNASIEGTINDTSGAAISGATITVTNQATRISQQLKTSAGGFYRVSALPPGEYTVTATFSGFKPQAVSD